MGSIFRQMHVAHLQPNIVTWTTLIAACANARPKCFMDAEEAFRSMLKQNISPNASFIRKFDLAVGSTRRAFLCRQLGIDDRQIPSVPSRGQGRGHQASWTADEAGWKADML